MPYILIIIVLCVTVSSSMAKTESGFPVGDYSLHFNQAGEVIKPDEHYVFQAIQDNKDGSNKSAIKNFQKAASYGNTFAVYYTGLLYLQEQKYIEGYAWLSMVETNNFPHADNTLDLLHKLKIQLNPEEIKVANNLLIELKKVYGAQQAFVRRKTWSRDFKLAGTHIKGYVPNNLRIQTDLSLGNIGVMNSNVSALDLKNSLKSFVYEYEHDYRITHGDVKLGDFEVIEPND